MNTIDIRNFEPLQTTLELDPNDFSCHLIINGELKLILTFEQLVEFRKQTARIEPEPEQKCQISTHAVDCTCGGVDNS